PYYESLEDTQGLANGNNARKKSKRRFQIGKKHYISLFAVYNVSRDVARFWLKDDQVLICC
ncbi:hypothetical protein, partial [Leptospira borgpetersenii]|uniref:hypothetical protein n=1 Tax=Leptospira borgpetersenii TaxID=174 RepID=UPI0027DC61AD